MARTSTKKTGDMKKASTNNKAESRNFSEEPMAGDITLAWYMTGSGRLAWYVTGYGRSLSQAQRKAMIRPAVAIKFEDLSEDLVDRDM